MAGSTADLLIRVQANIGQAETALASLRTQITDVGKAVAPGGAGGGFVETTAATRAMGMAAAESGNLLEGLGDHLVKVGQQATGFAAGMFEFQAIQDVFAALSENAIGFNAHIEQSTVAWTTFLHSGQAASDMIQGLMTFSAKTPFRFQGLEDSARLLTAMGVRSSQVLPLLTDIGNAVSATGRGAEGMQRVAYTLGEIQSLGQVDDRTLRQLTIDGGIPAFEMLAQSIGVSTGEIRKMASAGQISADQFMAIFHSFVSSNWGDMMAKQALTFNGALSTLQDNLQFATARGFAPLFDAVRDATVAAAQFSQTADFQAWGDQTATTIQGVVDDLDRLVFAYQRAHDAAVALPGAAAGLSQGVDATVRGAGIPIIPFGEMLRGNQAPPAAGDLAGQFAAALPVEAGKALMADINPMLPALQELIPLLRATGDAMGYVQPPAKHLGDTMGEIASTGLESSAAATRRTRDELEGMKLAADDATVGGINLNATMDELTATLQRAATNARDFAAVESALGGGAKLAADATAADASLGGLDAQIAGVQARIDAVKASSTSAGGSLKAMALDAIPGLQAFDAATFGLTQKLAGVQLGIEQKTLARMERRPARTPGQEEARLQEEIKVRGLERQVDFGGSIRAAQQASSTGGAAAVKKEETAALEAELKTLQAARTTQAQVVADQNKWIDETVPKLGDLGAAARGVIDPVTAMWENFAIAKGVIEGLSPADALKTIDAWKGIATTVTDDAIVAALIAQGKPVPKGFAGLQNTPSAVNPFRDLPPHVGIAPQSGTNAGGFDPRQLGGGVAPPNIGTGGLNAPTTNTVTIHVNNPVVRSDADIRAITDQAASAVLGALLGNGPTTSNSASTQLAGTRKPN